MAEPNIAIMSAIGGFFGGACLTPITFFFMKEWYSSLGPVKKAERARQKKWDNYYIEFLSYGYSEREADDKADQKMRADAVEVDSVKL